MNRGLVSGYQVRLGLRRPTARLRRLPDYLIIGAQKGGTTSLHHYLAQGSGFQSPLTKEVHYFDHHYGDGEFWYRAHFPMARTAGLAGEASPFYLLHPLAPERVAALLPGVPLIAVLRDPIHRAYSHFNHSRAYGREECEDFGRALDLEEERTGAAWAEVSRTGERQEALDWFTYARRSLYVPQLRRWLDHVAPEQLRIVLSEDLFGDPEATVGSVRSSLGLPAVSSTPIDFKRLNARSYPDMGAATLDRLRELFAPDVAELEAFLGRPTGWLAD